MIDFVGFKNVLKKEEGGIRQYCVLCGERTKEEVPNSAWGYWERL